MTNTARKPDPYIGVTGFMTRAEVHAAIVAYDEAWAEIGREPSHRLMIGVLASNKTLAGQPNKYPRRYPLIGEVWNVFASASPRVLNLVHYATGGVREGLTTDLSAALRRGGVGTCDGLQINAAWPWPVDIEGFAHAFPHGRVVLQLGPSALAQFQHRAREVAQRVQEYGSSITDVLIDVSGGRGIEIDPENVRHIIDDLEAFTTCGIGVAGGLCAETLPALAPLFRAHPNLSIDAEGRLRDDADGGGNLDLDKVRAYLRAAVALVAGGAS